MDGSKGLVGYKKTVLFGDSITQFGYNMEEGGWVGKLSEWHVRGVEFFNRGFSGYTTRSAKEILPLMMRWGEEGLGGGRNHDLGELLVVIFFGANDAVDGEKNPAQYVGLKEYGENLEAMITFLESKGVSRESIVLASPPPVNEGQWEAGDRSNQNVQAYTKECARVCASRGVEHVNLYEIFTSHCEDWAGTLFNDGLHMSREGNGILAEVFSGVVKRKLGVKRYDVEQDDTFLLPRWQLYKSVNDIRKEDLK
eukprot:Nk52_evm9s319 gene=Nk52_evmTU9s319